MIESEIQLERHIRTFSVEAKELLRFLYHNHVLRSFDPFTDYGHPEHLFELNLDLHNINSKPNLFVEIWERISQIPSISHLNLNNNDLTIENAPDFGLLGSQRRISLNLSNNHFQAIPLSILKLSQLTRLTLNGNPLEQIHETSIRPITFPQLYEISLSSTGLKEIPRFIKNLPALRTLILRNNQISSLSSFLGELPFLHVLNLTKNNFGSMPSDSKSSMNPKLPQSLTSIKLARNRFREIPNWVQECQKIQYLNFSSNYLRTIPEYLFYLPELSQLDLSCNQIRWLPEIQQPTSSYLNVDLSHNVLKSLPESFLLTKLHLDINFNCWNAFYRDIFNIPPPTELFYPIRLNWENSQEALLRMNEYLPSLIMKIQQGIPLTEVDRSYPFFFKNAHRLEFECRNHPNPTSEDIKTYLYPKFDTCKKEYSIPISKMVFFETEVRVIY